MRIIGWLMAVTLWVNHAMGQGTAVGFADSLLFDASQTYQFGDYIGQRPMQVIAWFPIERASNKVLTFGEILLGDTSSDLYSWQKSQQAAKLACWRNNGFADLQTGALVGAEADVLNDQQHLLLLATASCRQKWPALGQFPVVIYHHGSRGFGAENHRLAEKWAAAGFLVLAADFHLPHKQWEYGLAEGIDSSMAGLRSLFAFAKGLAGQKPIYLVGHSWGAQQGWRFLAEDAPDIAGFISLETTLEYKTDALEIADKWPFLYESLVVEAKKVKVPVLAVASQRNGEGFPFFTDKNVGWHVQVGVVPDFSHEAFTSLLFLRLHLSTQPDDGALRAQLELYKALGDYLTHFLKSPGTAFPKPPDPQKFQIIYSQP